VSRGEVTQNVAALAACAPPRASTATNAAVMQKGNSFLIFLI
jgi:hypothetical protein